MPSVAPEVVDKVRVDVFAFASMMLIVAGLKLAVTPDGSVDVDKFTAPVNPASGVTVTV